MNSRRLGRAALALALLSLLARPSLARTTIQVPADQPTIQAGIDAAANGDTVLVSPGTYPELLDFKGKAITVTSGATTFAQAASTIIQGGASNGPVVTFQTNEPATAILNGFTIQGGTSGTSSGGILFTLPGGGLYLDGSSPTITNNIIQNNIGCGILVYNHASPLIQGNNISLNTGPSVANGGPACGSPAGPTYEGTGIGILDAGNVSIVGNTISNNESPAEQGFCGAAIYLNGADEVLISNNLIEYTGQFCGQGIGYVLYAFGGAYTPGTAKLLLVQNIFNNATAGEDGSMTPPYPQVVSVDNTFFGLGIDFNFSYSQSALVNNIMYAPEPQQVVNQYDPVSFLLTCGQLPSNENQQLDIHDDLLFNPGTIYPTFCTLGPGMVSADAQLVDPANGNYRLQPTSPAIDAGDINAPNLPAADFAGKNRTVCGTVDLGAYNHHPAPPIALTAGQGTISGGSTASFSVQLTGNCNTPTGPITFLDGTNSLGTANLTPGGSAAFSTSALTVGTHTITAAYPGDFNFDPSTSAALTQVVTGYPTVTTLVAVTPNPASAFQTITFSASVASRFGTPNGSLSFLANGQPIASPDLNSSGQASATVNTLAAGTYTITAAYNPSIDYAGSSSNSIVLVVNGAPTAVSLASAPNPSTYGQSVTFTATVNAAGSSNIPTGALSFRDGSNAIGSATLNAAGAGTFTTASLAVGAHPITAVYSGSANDNAATSATLNQIVTAAPATITLTGTPNPANTGQTVTLTAFVDFAGSPATAGSVTFADQSGTLGTAQLANGQAVLTTSTLAIGTHNITASIAASGNFASGISPVLAEVIEAHDFAIALSPATLTLVSGQKGQAQVRLTSLGSYAGTLNLTASQIPTYASLTFTPASLPLSAGNTTTAQLAIDTASLPPGVARNQAPPQSRRLPLAFAVACCILPILLGKRRPRTPLVALVLALALATSLTGCASISYPLHRVAPGTYLIPITATGPAAQTTHTTQLTLIVTE